MPDEIIDDKPIVEEGASSAPEKEETPKEEKDEQSIADVVKDVMSKHNKDDDEPESSTGEEEGEEEEEGEKEDSNTEEEEPSEESKPKEKGELLPFHNHPRWKQVLSERDEARGEVDKLKPLAETTESLRQFCQSNSLTREDLQEALELAALLRNDPKEFKSKMQGYLEALDITVGDKLPKDLQKKVDDGVIDMESAKELAQSRIRLNQAETGTKRSAEQAHRNSQQALSSALNMWEQSQRKTDPDFESRLDLLKDRITALWLPNPPQTPQEAIQIAETALKEVKERLAKFQPKPKVQKKFIPSGGSSTNNGENLAIDSMEDIGKVVRAIALKHR